MRRLAMFALAAAALGAAPPVGEPTTFPHARGGKWEYRRTLWGRVKPLVLQAGGVTKDGGRAFVRFTGDWESLGLEERMEMIGGRLSYRVSVGRGDAPRALIGGRVREGDRWASLIPIGCGGFAPAEAWVEGVERVTVPAGRFRAVKVRYTGVIFGIEGSMVVWYADGVGVVKQVYRPESTNMVIELVRHTPGG